MPGGNRGSCNGGLSQSELTGTPSHAWYDAFVEGFHGIAYRSTLDFVPVFFRGAVKRITGYDDAQFLAGQPRWDQVIHPDDLQALFDEHERRLHTEPGFSYERSYRIVRADGKLRWVLEHVKSVAGTTGDVVGVQGAIYDITAQRDAEHRLADSEARYRAIVECATDGILIADLAQRRLQYGNPAACRMLGYSAEELTQLRVDDIHPESSLAEVTAAFEAQARGELELAPCLPVLRKDGTILLADVRTSPANFAGVPCNIGLFSDVTEKTFYVNQIRVSERRYREIFNAVNDLIVIHHPQTGRPLDCNRKCLDALGYSREEFLGLTTGTWGQGVPPYAEAEALQRIRQAMDEGPQTVVWRAQRRGGEQLWVEVCLRRAALGGDDVVLAVARDITQRLELEAEREKATRHESLSVLAGGIAHDFNNMLLKVQGNVALARRSGPWPEGIADRLCEAEMACRQAAALSQQLLALSSGGEPVKRLASLGQIVQEAATFASRGTALRFSVDFADDLWPVEVDAAQISRVTQNLVINASESAGDVLLAIRGRNIVLPPGDGGGELQGKCVEVTFEDTGGGIEPEDLAKVFDPYFSTKPKGRGLGLAAVYSIVQRHGGSISVQSQPGQGSEFKITLPASVRAPALRAAQAAPSHAALRARVLLMDDDAGVRDVAERLLRALGCEVTSASQGEEAIALGRAACASGQPFDIAIVDLTIAGGMGGIEAAAHLRTLHPPPACVVSSGYSERPVMARCGDYGFVAALAKPYTIHTLAEILTELSSSRST